MTGKSKAILAAASLGAGVVLREAFARSNEENLKGQVVLITGGSKGLGLALARRFAKEGCRVVICARHREELHGAKRELENKGTEVLAIPCDVTDERAVREMVAEAEEHFGGIDILVNNAGQISVGPFTSMTVEDFDSAMRVMFWGVVYPTLAVLPSYLKKKSGRIVNITSIGGKVSVPHLVPYTCAKFAATGFSEGIRAELKSEGITVTTIAPGLMRTGSFVNALFKGNQEEEGRWFSLGASNPVLAMDADTAAKKIITATKRGESERVLSGPAKLLSGMHGVAPGATADLLGALATALLPVAMGEKNEARPGSKLAALQSPAMRALLTFGQLAARRYRQRPA